MYRSKVMFLGLISSSVTPSRVVNTMICKPHDLGFHLLATVSALNLIRCIREYYHHIPYPIPHLHLPLHFNIFVTP